MKKMMIAMMIAAGLFSASFANAKQAEKQAPKVKKEKTVTTAKDEKTKTKVKTKTKTPKVKAPVKQNAAVPASNAASTNAAPKKK